MTVTALFKVLQSNVKKKQTMIIFSYIETGKEEVNLDIL